MILIGESLNVISKKIGKAFKERDPKPIQEEALFQREKGMDYIDINLGPAKKEGHELMPWVVKTVQEVVPDVPLALDTSNIDAIAAALKVYKPTAKPPLVNSIMVRPERYETMLPIAKDHNADFIALIWGPEGLPRHETEFEQAPAHGGLSLVPEALCVVAHVDDHAPGAFAQRGQTDGRH